jgi:hypothetical protein
MQPATKRVHDFLSAEFRALTVELTVADLRFSEEFCSAASTLERSRELDRS